MLPSASYRREPLFHDAQFDVVVIASSYGGLAALKTILALVPSDFPAPIMVVQHIGACSILPELLGRSTRLNVKHAIEGEVLRPGTAYVAPPLNHLLISPSGICTLWAGDKVNHLRPAADLLFRSAAERFGRRTLGVVLTGFLYDGAAGSSVVRAQGGVMIAQDPSTCEAAAMPEAAIRTGSVDLVLAPEGIAAAIVSLVSVPGVTALFGIGSHRFAAA